MIQLIIRHARWEESAQALPRTPPRSLVPTGSKSRLFGTCRVGQMSPASSCSSSSTRQTQFLPVAGVETDQKLPLMVLCVQPSWKGGDLLQTNCQTSSSPTRTVPGMLFPNCMGHTRPPAQEPAWFCLLGRGTTHHLLMAVANQGLHTCSTCMWH